MQKFHALEYKQVFDSLETGVKGISISEAEKRLKEYGFNEIEKKQKKSLIALFLEQFNNFLIILLLIAVAISLALGELLEAASMFSIIILTAAMGFVQEYRAEKSMNALEKLSAPQARVMREGRESKIPAKELVPGDLIIVEAGDIIPADARLFEENGLSVDESVLTGESVPSSKTILALKTTASIGDQKNMVFSGTTVTYGKAKAIVTSTGIQTEFGKIASTIQTTAETKTPLQIKFEELAKQLGIGALGLISIVFVLSLLKGELSFTEVLLFSLSLAVAAVPNSLPAIVTISLSMGAGELAKKKMIIRKLPATESLGAVTVICSDKTGTITKNEMTAVKVYSQFKEYEVTGSGYEYSGKILLKEKTSGKDLEQVIRIGLLCNNARIEERDGKNKLLGDPTEGALLVLAEKAGYSRDAEEKKYSFVKELSFDSDRKRMTTIVKNNEKQIALVKGAPEIILSTCNRILDNGKIRKITKEDKEKILSKNKEYAENALRVLGFAFTEDVSAKPTIENTEKELVFTGLVGLIDPARDEVIDALKQTKAAGIQTIMITGDYALTAKAIGEKIGLLEKGDLVVTGEELASWSDSELDSKINKIKVFARTQPIQKSRIVESLKRQGHIVAMTGDGVNDAPALKKADIGVSMGITGTDVAKEVSKATLADDNFATIVNAIAEGRNVYDKIIKSAKYLLSCNAGEIAIVIISILLGFPLPLIPLQILLMNLLTDGLPALGLGFEKLEDNVMKRPPRNPNEKPLDNQMLFSIIFFGLIMGLGSFYLFAEYYDQGIEKARTIAFTTLVVFQLFAAIGSRSLEPFHKLNLLTNKWLLLGILSSLAIQLILVYWPPAQIIFETTSLEIGEWIQIMIISSMGFFLMEASKIISKAMYHRKAFY
ncbi:cation-translocating P-type ATPase [Candidatus Micrarchaeota archaeon]|nr:cation-translocating P-type ATPase [Candidatus Micrarchaeota archaeon]